MNYSCIQRVRLDGLCGVKAQKVRLNNSSFNYQSIAVSSSHGNQPSSPSPSSKETSIRHHDYLHFHFEHSPPQVESLKRDSLQMKLTLNV